MWSHCREFPRYKQDLNALGKSFSIPISFSCQIDKVLPVCLGWGTMSQHFSFSFQIKHEVTKRVSLRLDPSVLSSCEISYTFLWTLLWEMRCWNYGDLRADLNWPFLPPCWCGNYLIFFCATCNHAVAKQNVTVRCFVTELVVKIFLGVKPLFDCQCCIVQCYQACLEDL